MNSFKQLTKDGTLKRADAYKVRHQDIVILEGFNTRDMDDRTVAHILGLFDFIMAGGDLPALEVVPMDDAKVGCIDGHCRHTAIGMAIAASGPVFDKAGVCWVEVKQFSGDAAAASARIVTSNSGLQLTPLETARVYKRLADEYGLKPLEIAVKVGRTRQHVDQLLHLANAGDDVQGMVAAGDVSATEAMKAAREHGGKAGEVLGEQLAKVKAAGGSKVTAGKVKAWTPPAKVVGPLVESMDHFEANIKAQTRATLAQMEAAGTLGDDTISISLPAGTLWYMLHQYDALKDERYKAEDRARAKADKAAQ
jgi:ParB family chromosome partitioning protein